MNDTTRKSAETTARVALLGDGLTVVAVQQANALSEFGIEALRARFGLVIDRALAEGAAFELAYRSPHTPGAQASASKRPPRARGGKARASPAELLPHDEQPPVEAV